MENKLDNNLQLMFLTMTSHYKEKSQKILAKTFRGVLDPKPISQDNLSLALESLSLYGSLHRTRNFSEREHLIQEIKNLILQNLNNWSSMILEVGVGCIGWAERFALLQENTDNILAEELLLELDEKELSLWALEKFTSKTKWVYLKERVDCCHLSFLMNISLFENLPSKHRNASLYLFREDLHGDQDLWATTTKHEALFDYAREKEIS